MTPSPKNNKPSVICDEERSEVLTVPKTFVSLLALTVLRWPSPRLPEVLVTLYLK